MWHQVNSFEYAILCLKMSKLSNFNSLFFLVFGRFWIEKSLPITIYNSWLLCIAFSCIFGSIEKCSIFDHFSWGVIRENHFKSLFRNFRAKNEKLNMAFLRPKWSEFLTLSCKNIYFDCIYWETRLFWQKPHFTFLNFI